MDKRMRQQARELALTADHIARVHKVVQDSGVPVGLQLHTDADYAGWVESMIRSNPSPRSPLRLFAYGSLIWKPELEHVGEQRCLARGWHRAFCFRMPRFRGTPEQPGLMMALDRGGQCAGILLDLPTGNPEVQLDKLFRREFTVKPVNSMPRWIAVQTATGRTSALTFVMNRKSPLYAGKLPLEEVADILARACGHWGTGAEYLLNTVSHLEAKGIQDRGLWKLQRLVAEKIDLMHPV
jgi:cation transport protein ChaC